MSWTQASPEEVLVTAYKVGSVSCLQLYEGLGAVDTIAKHEVPPLLSGFVHLFTSLTLFFENSLRGSKTDSIPAQRPRRLALCDMELSAVPYQPTPTYLGLRIRVLLLRERWRIGHARHFQSWAGRRRSCLCRRRLKCASDIMCPAVRCAGL